MHIVTQTGGVEEGVASSPAERMVAPKVSVLSVKDHVQGDNAGGIQSSRGAYPGLQVEIAFLWCVHCAIDVVVEAAANPD